MFSDILFVFILGLIIGSFLNVLILRINTGRGFGGRSKCLSCGYTLTPRDLIPLFSWLLLRGKCRECKTKISPQYPLVELATGIIFVLILISTFPFYVFPQLVITSFIWNSIIFSILIVIFVYDIYHKIIPNILSYTFAVLAFLQALLVFTSVPEPTTLATLNIWAGPIMFAPFFLLWLVSSGRWIGLGDGKLALGIGWYLGFIGGISAIVLAFWIGALFAIVLMLIERLKVANKGITMKTEIPFAPFLIIGTVLQFFLRIDVLGIGMFF